jgi:hypothetical protein
VPIPLILSFPGTLNNKRDYHALGILPRSIGDRERDSVEVMHGGNVIVNFTRMCRPDSLGAGKVPTLFASPLASKTGPDELTAQPKNIPGNCAKGFGNFKKGN